MYGAEAGGGVRVIMAGLRVVTSAKGAILAAEDRLPQAPTSTTPLPERLGGGFLFVLGSTIWRADRWLGPAKPIFSLSSAIQSVLPGLDRVYVKTQGAVVAIDGRSGQALDLGPWPASPYVASYAAADGWRAAAVTDLRGVVATFDAGATWRAVELPIEAKQVVVSGDSLAVGGFESGRSEAWFELRADGAVSRLGAPPREVKAKLTPTPPPRPTYSSYSAPVPTPTIMTAPPPRPEPARAREGEGEDKEDVSVKTFGKRPLATAIEDGWPLTDGTAVIARDGSLAKVRLTDGALSELVRDAFPLTPARCHPISLARSSAPGAFGFVCGEPRGTTVIYAYDPMRGRVEELKRFEKPRVVTSSGNGALAVRGPCAEDAEPTPPPRPDPAKLDKGKDPKEEKSAKSAKDAQVVPEVKEPPKSEVHPYCVFGHDNQWREVHVRGDVGGERVVVLADGRIVVISPPQAMGAPARVTVLRSGAPAATAPITFPRVASDVGRVLRLGLWLDGFEERRPGVIGGWLEAGGTMLGIEIALDGKATPGQFIRDAGLPFVSGKYGFGWTPSRRGYETTDGGMTWNSVDVPDPLVPAAKVDRRACGPIGCLAGGWLRVGWGEGKHAPAPQPPPPYRSGASALLVPSLSLSCDPLAPMPAASAAKTTAPQPKPVPPPRIHIGVSGGPPVLGTFNGLRELHPFYSHAPQALRENSETGVDVEVRDLIERYPNVGPLARIYGWGPKTGDWDTLGRWQVKWLSPFAGWPDVRASLPAPPPAMVLDMTKMTTPYYGGGYAMSSNLQFAAADDGAHGLLIGRRVIRSEAVLFELEAERAPVEIHRADGEPFGEIEGVVRAAGRWFIATPLHGGVPATVIWQVEGAVARELVRVPRHAAEQASGAGRTRLARSVGGRAIGLVVEGPSMTERATNARWVLPIDLETGGLGEPEALGFVDLAGRTLDACTDDATGWVLDTSMPSSIKVKVPAGTGSINGIQARLRLTSTRACVERIAGTYDGQSQERATQLTRPGAPVRNPAFKPGELLVTAMSAQMRFPLKCTIASAR
jgi:hypothetical protein